MYFLITLFLRFKLSVQASGVNRLNYKHKFRDLITPYLASSVPELSYHEERYN